MVIFSNVNPTSHTAISIAQSLASERCQGQFGSPHLLRAILHNEVGFATQLVAWNFDLGYLKDWADIRIEQYPKAARPISKPPADEKVQAVLEVADIVRMKLGEETITPLCLLAALAKPNVAFSADQLKTFPMTENDLLQRSLQDAAFVRAVQPEQPSKNGTLPFSAQSLLEYCSDKTALAREGRLDPIVGREMELKAMTEILGRRSKPNVIVTGEPGIGKTALVNGFAQCIIQGNVTAALQSAVIFELDAGALLAGASYRGEVEERMKKIIRELQQFDKAILFVDEIHTLLDTNNGFSGVANLLKPALNKGELTVIGTASAAAFRTLIESDGAFRGCFEALPLQEPNEAYAVQMVEAVLPAYEQHHGIYLAPGSVTDAVRLAKRYLKERQLPDAAIQLIDRTMSALRLNGEKAQSELGNIASEVTVAEPRQVEPSDLAAVVAQKTGIPLGRIQSGEREKLLQMETSLRQRVVGQDHALNAVSEAVLESRSGLNKPGQPIGSFFLLGPTGTGKTELAKSIAELLFDDENAMIRFDMSEFKGEHSADLLYGASPGFVGFEKGGALVNKIREKPYAVVLFDEIEKAHSSVFDVFLSILDEGRLEDKHGKMGDFSNALILFTSNIGARDIAHKFDKGGLPSSAELMETLKGHFRPEFLGRLTEIVPFAPISKEHITAIFNIQLKSLEKALELLGIRLELSEESREHLALEGYSPEYGARPLRGVIRSQIKRPLSKMLIAGTLISGMTAKATLTEKGELLWNVENER